jgi:hypothetical protein
LPGNDTIADRRIGRRTAGTEDVMKTLWKSMLIALMVLGLGAIPALSLEPSDGNLTEQDQDPEFGDPDAFDAVDEVADLLETEIDEDEDVPAGVRRFRVVGIWQYTGRDKGWFAGKVYVKVKNRRILFGRIKGVFEKSLHGDRELVGVVLDRDGDYRGTLKGLYGARGFRAVWSRRGALDDGVLKAKFVAPFGRAGFVGRMKAPKLERPDEDDEDADS